MSKLLIPFVAALLFGATTLSAQTPKSPLNSTKIVPIHPPLAPLAQPEAGCGNAGTFTIGPIVGESNDGSTPQLFLCFGDQFDITHNGDFNLSGDPIGSTPPAVSYAFYNCSPTIDGPALANVLGDPCLVTTPPPPGGIWVADVATASQAAGNQTFSNTGAAQSLFNMGNPVELTFGAITLDYWDAVNFGWEGTPAGPCVDINQQQAFSVVYLNPITILNKNTAHLGQDCIGSFKIRGGASEFLGNSSTYDATIQKQGTGPGEAIITSKKSDQTHTGLSTVFSVNEPGTYVVNIEDGKSCGTTFTMDMAGCDPSDNVVLISGSQTVQQGATICVPISVKNFTDLVTLSATLKWCAGSFEYVSHAATSALNGLDFGTVNTANGQLTFNWFDPSFNSATLPDNTVIFTLCLKAIGQNGDCCKIEFDPSPTEIIAEKAPIGARVGVSVEEGTVCIAPPGTVNCQISITSNCSSTGAFEVGATGGTAPYTVGYTFSNGNPLNPPQQFAAGQTLLFDNLSTGDYVITVTDAAGATCSQTVTIASLAVQFSGTNPTCFGSTNGSATAIVSNNGTTVANPGPQYTFSWSIPSSPNTPTVTGLSEGNYSVTVTNSVSGCTDIAGGSIDAPNKLNVFQKNKIDASCTGIANGGLGFNVNGGTPGYTAQLTGPTPITTPTAFPFSTTGILSGTYYIKVTDTKGCMANDSIIVPANKEYDLDASVTGIFCAGQCTGIVSADLTTNPSGGTVAPLTWNWSSGTPMNSGTTSTVSNLCKGILTLNVTDATGCGVSKTFDIPENAPLKVIGSIVQPSCTGVLGTVSAQGVSGGQTTYKWLWSTGQTTPVINNQPAGDYIVTITDANGCTLVWDTTLALPNPPIVNLDAATDPKCSNTTDGKITITPVAVDPGTTPFAFKWSNNATTEDLNNIACGPYSVTVTDNRLCTATATFSLNCPAAITIIDVQAEEPTCFGDTDGSLTIVAGGGTGILKYNWSPAQPMTPTISGPAGTYNLTLTDSQNCSLTASEAIPAAPSINITISNQVAAQCAGDQSCDGAATAAAVYSSGPAPVPPFNFVWSWGTPTVTFNGATATSLCAGAAKVVVTDPTNGCTNEKAITVAAPPALELDSVLTVPPTCNGGCDALLNALAIGGVAPYIYQWTIITAAGPSTVNGAQVQNACAGNVLLKVTDANGCELDQTLPTIPEPDPVQVDIDLSATADPQCAGLSNGVLGLLVKGGNGNFSFEYNPPVGTTNPVQNLAAGSYSVTATDQKGCSGTATHVLTEPGPIFFEIAPYEPIKCFGEETNLLIDTAFGGNGPDFLYDVDQTGFIPLSLDTRIEGGEHVITVQDSEGCLVSDTITIDQPDEIIVSLGPDIEIELGDTTQQLNPQFNIQIDSLVWLPATGLAGPTDLRPYLQNLTTTTYTLTIFDANGCSGTDAIIVEVDPNRKVFIPNAFKPGTSLSDHFRVFVGNGVKTINFMQVYDRWGEKMYELKDFYPSNGDYSEGWDGTFRGKNANPGVYVYVVEVEFLDGRTLLYRGDVALVR